MLAKGAWKTHLHQTCANHRLAINFLCHPPAAVDKLLRDWGKYMASEEHKREQKRIVKVDEKDENAVREKRKQIRVKSRVHKLRGLVRWHRNLNNTDSLTVQERRWYQKWETGKLQEELDELTIEHGYGQYRGKQLGPSRITGNEATWV